MAGKYSIFDIAGWFLEKEPMPHKRLQKLCYYAFAWDQAIRNGNLIRDCQFEAWIHGPVNVKLFELLKGSKIRELTLDDLPSDIVKITNINDDDFLESVWLTYGCYGADTLEIMTHSEVPWKKARLWYDTLDECHEIISTTDMKEFYSSIYHGIEDIS
ncbi:MAG: DUF4065 domain-containing protein [Erysipelotrichaceae bacterium]|nr:DUF4065 domain-containing protein [Erysipelotrichaceae bacterium]